VSSDVGPRSVNCICVFVASCVGSGVSSRSLNAAPTVFSAETEFASASRAPESRVRGVTSAASATALVTLSPPRRGPAVASLGGRSRADDESIADDGSLAGDISARDDTPTRSPSRARYAAGRAFSSARAFARPGRARAATRGAVSASRARGPAMAVSRTAAWAAGPVARLASYLAPAPSGAFVRVSGTGAARMPKLVRPDTCRCPAWVWAGRMVRATPRATRAAVFTPARAPVCRGEPLPRERVCAAPPAVPRKAPARPPLLPPKLRRPADRDEAAPDRPELPRRALPCASTQRQTQRSRKSAKSTVRALRRMACSASSTSRACACV